jgi:small subunit ribosomal protein S8
MSMTDPIADMLTRIRNANQANHTEVEMPASRMKAGIAKLLLEQGYISGFESKTDEHGELLVIGLKYGRNRERVISGIKRISKPGRRIYARKDRLPKVLGGLGVAIISTSRGLVTSVEAQRLGLGGEVICFVW